jgi:hypothetical protein
MRRINVSHRVSTETESIPISGYIQGYNNVVIDIEMWPVFSVGFQKYGVFNPLLSISVSR